MNSKGKTFAAIIDSEESNRHEYPTLIYDKETALGDGVLYFNNQRQNGALFFATFHLSSNKQPNKWWRQKASFINEGWYVSIRELQLYGEFSRESMLWKQTSEKIHRVEKMLLGRTPQ